MSNPKATAIVVAGMHRSGTSALASGLAAMGVDLGGKLLAPGDDNPRGYWEHEGAVAIHERLLASLGRHWDDVRALPDGWEASEAARVAAGEIEALIARDFARSPVWAIKDPRICRFLPLWIAAVGKAGMDLVVLFAARRPSEVAASIEARNQWLAPVGELLWLRHVLEAEAASRGVRRTAVLYDDLLEHPGSTISGALASLGVRHEGVKAAEGKLRRVVDVAERHHRHDGGRGSSGFGAIAFEAFEALSEVARGKDAWGLVAGCAGRFDALREDTGGTIDAVADMAQRLREEGASARLEILEVSSKLNAQVKWSEEAVAIRTELRAEHQAALEGVIAQRERLAAELRSASEREARERTGHAAEREASEQERVRLSAELESVSARAAAERREHEAERARLSAELESVSARAAAERQGHEAERVRLSAELESVSARYNAELRGAEEEGMRLAAEIAALRQSTSWRMTRPLRWIGRFLRATPVRSGEQ